MSTFSKLIDFTRSSTGTYLDSVVYGDELVTNGTFDDGTTGWAAHDSNLSVVNGTLKVEDTVGTFGYARYEFSTTVGKAYILKGTLVDATTGNTNANYVQIGVPASGTSIRNTNIGINNNTDFAFPFVATGTTTRIGLASGQGVGEFAFWDNISVKEIIGGQGTAGTPLLRTADTNEPRLEYDASGQPLGLLIEEQRTNKVLYSNRLSGSAWSGTNCSITTDSTTSPDGSINASKLTCSVDGGSASVWQFAIGAGLNGNYSNSIYLKADTLNYAQLNVGYLTASFVANFDLVNGTVTHILGTGATITDVGNGWFRCTMPFDTTQQGGFGVTPIDSMSSTRRSGAVGSVFVYGAQLEAGSFPTSYIPTSGSTVTRNQDVCKVTAFKYHQNDQQGTLFVEGTPNISQATYRRFAEFEYSNLRFSIQTYTGKIASYTRNAANSTNNSIGTQNPYTPYRTQKSAFTVSAGYAAKSNNGLDVQSETDVLGLDEPNVDLYIGQQDNATDQLCGHIKRVLYFPTKLSNDELVELTKPSSSPTMSLTFDGQATSELVEGLHD